METLKSYYRLTKPGIVYGNLMYAAAGFLLAAGRHIDLPLFIATLAGTSLVIAGACVYNNVLDRNIDRRMKRTQKRAMVTQVISIRNALIYATVLAIAGFGLLMFFVNWLVVAIEAAGIIVYVLVYGWAKRSTIHSTVIGSVSGSVPPVAGYAAVSGRLDGGALLLFLILTFWQMPHFYAIATYRLKDYREAGLPVLTVKKGVRAAKYQIVAYIIAFIIAAALLSLYGYTGYVYLIAIVGLGLWWLKLGLEGFKAEDDNKWGRQVFLFSLIITLAFSLLLALNAWLP
jgi:protoheme IX farnesyltransferase